ncbi:MAG: hypothetical protein M1834_003563 [Cirrosporium novae-zelandiae]|nr:MAG: hypothetical protein M1834_003563 [Cirrosporium novae-zelandiae]
MPIPQPPNTPVLSQFSLKGKVAAVTGGARGIGLEAARGLAEAGADVALIYSTTKDAPAKAEEIAKATGQKVQAYQADVRNCDSITSTINQIHQEFGRLDIAVANAGITQHVSALECTPDDFSNMMKVNLDGAFYTAQAAGKIFHKQGSGNVIFTASVSAILVNLPQRQAAYNASKAAVVQLARCLAVEWADFARVNCISPGFISTDMIGELPEEWQSAWLQMTPIGRFCDPYELKGSFVYLASDASSYVTGANVIVDGAYTLP